MFATLGGSPSTKFIEPVYYGPLTTPHVMARLWPGAYGWSPSQIGDCGPRVAVHHLQDDCSSSARTDLRLVTAGVDLELLRGLLCQGCPMLVVFDSNVYDALADDETLLQSLTVALDSGRLRLFTTHVQRDELAAVPDLQRRERLLAVLQLAEPVATGGLVMGSSRLAEARLLSEAGATLFDDKMRNGASDVRGTNDALIISTARFEEATLVSQDRRCRARARRAGVPSIDVEEFVERLNHC